MRNLILLLLCAVVGCCILGCKKETIQFNRTSAFSDVMNGAQSDKPTVKRSSGVMIYKDKPNQQSNTNQGAQNNDINFDIPLHLK